MRSAVFLLILACTMLILLTGCHTSRKTASHKAAKPKFIDGVYIAGHNSTNATDNAVDPRKPAEKGRSAGRNHATSKSGNSGKGVTPAGRPLIKSDKVDKLTEPGVVKTKYAQILGIKPKEITNYSLYQFIDKWYGTDYRLGGKNKSGIDCSGFAQKLYAEVYGIDLLRTSPEQYSNSKHVKKKKDAEEGDLVFFRIRSKHITHVGVYLANDYFVHASTTGGVMISNLNEEYWTKYYAGCGRISKD